jgi:hypothetical protein
VVNSKFMSLTKLEASFSELQKYLTSDCCCLENFWHKCSDQRVIYRRLYHREC